MASHLRYDAAPERRRWILAQLAVTGFLSVPDLAKDLGVSDMTVRRDLRRLEDDGEVLIVHGGVRLPHAHLRSTAFVTRAHTQAIQKGHIARHATWMIDDRDAVAVDAGTTTYPIVQMLSPSFAGCIVTPSVPVVHALLDRSGIRVVGLGGDLHAASQAFVGPLAVEATRRLRVRTFFLGAAAVDDRGVYVEADIERPTKLALMEIADRVVLLADQTKFERSAPVLLCSLDSIDCLVTDQPLPTHTEREVRSRKIEIHIAQTEEATG